MGAGSEASTTRRLLSLHFPSLSAHPIAPFPMPLRVYGESETGVVDASSLCSRCTASLSSVVKVIAAAHMLYRNAQRLKKHTYFLVETCVETMFSPTVNIVVNFQCIHLLLTIVMWSKKCSLLFTSLSLSLSRSPSPSHTLSSIATYLRTISWSGIKNMFLQNNRTECWLAGCRNQKRLAI